MSSEEARRPSGGLARASGGDIDFVPVFVIGSPRSGTTWVQHMLGSHELICAPQETGLFESYLGPWRATWAAQLAEATRPDVRRRGLPSVLTTEAFSALLRRTAVDIYGRALQVKPSARILLDKEPSNTYQTEVIAAVFPEARLIHVLRDGRDVASSLLAARSGWGRDWAPTTVARAAETWRDHVARARAARCLGLPYLEVRYEDLLERPVDSLVEVLSFLDIAIDGAAARAITQEFSFDRMRQGDGSSASGIAWTGELSRRGPMSEPEGFYRRGANGAWRDEWSLVDQGQFDRVAGQLLVELGYAADREWWQRSLAARLLRPGAALRDASVNRAKRRLRAWLARHPSLTAP